MRILSIIILVFFVASTSYLMFGKLGIPEGLTAVKPFDINRFSGTWYEVARLDHGFEKGLSHVTANYTVGKATFCVAGKNLSDETYIVDRTRGIQVGMPRTVQAGMKYAF